MSEAWSDANTNNERCKNELIEKITEIAEKVFEKYDLYVDSDTWRDNYRNNQSGYSDTIYKRVYNYLVNIFPKGIVGWDSENKFPFVYSPNKKYKFLIWIDDGRAPFSIRLVDESYKTPDHPSAESKHTYIYVYQTRLNGDNYYVDCSNFKTFSQAFMEIYNSIESETEGLYENAIEANKVFQKEEAERKAEQERAWQEWHNKMEKKAARKKDLKSKNIEVFAKKLAEIENSGETPLFLAATETDDWSERYSQEDLEEDPDTALYADSDCFVYVDDEEEYIGSFFERKAKILKQENSGSVDVIRVWGPFTKAEAKEMKKKKIYNEKDFIEVVDLNWLKKDSEIYKTFGELFKGEDDIPSDSKKKSLSKLLRSKM